MRCRILPIFLLVSVFVKAQTINVIPNPTAPSAFSWTDNGALSGYTGNPVILNNNLVVEYNASGTSDTASADFKLQLALYSGGVYHVIPNPDNGHGVYYNAVHIVFDSKLFIIYLNASGTQQLASFNGTSITLYPNPDAGLGYIGSPRILNNTLYVAYSNAAGATQFGRFTGSGISLINNPDNSSVGFFNNYSVVFGNKIASRYVTEDGTKHVATFDGTSWTIFPNPDNTSRGVTPIFPAVYHNKLYFRYYSATNQYQLLQFDGVNNPTLVTNPQNSGSNDGGTIEFPIVYNDTLFIQYLNTSGIYQLAKFGGTSLSLVPNPDNSLYGYYYKPVVYNNNLYILYQKADNTRYLAQYQTTSNSIKIYPNPDAGIGYWDYPIVYDNNLYMMYSDAQSNFQLSYFDGTSVKLITNPSGNYSSNGYNGYLGWPIIYNNLLYMLFGSVPYAYAGNLASFDGAVLPVNFISFNGKLDGTQALLTWSTANETNNKGYEVQRSFDGSTFNDIAFVKGAGSTTRTNNYSYTDVKVASGKNFYRLKQIDNNGSFIYSSVISLDYTKFNWSVRGNASVNNAWLQMQLDKNANVVVQLVSMNGNVINKINKNNLTAGSYAIPLNLSNASAGVYVVQLQVGDKLYSTKIVK